MKFVGNATPAIPAALVPTNPEDLVDKAYVDGLNTTQRLGANVTVTTSLTSILTYTVAANSAAVGDTYRLRVVGYTAAAGNPTFSVAVGSSNPGTSTVWTSNAVTGAAAAGAGAEVLMTVKTLGSSGTVLGGGFAFVSSNQGSTTAALTPTVNTTATWYITLRGLMSASTFTAVSATIEKL